MKVTFDEDADELPAVAVVDSQRACQELPYTYGMRDRAKFQPASLKGSDVHQTLNTLSAPEVQQCTSYTHQKYWLHIGSPMAEAGVSD